MNVVIIDYHSGNLHSAKKAFERAADDAGVHQSIIVSSDPKDVANADRVVLPGVGAFFDCYNGLVSIDGMMEALNEVVRQKNRPFLGICVGMQLLAEQGLEHGSHKGFGWIPGVVTAIKPDDKSLKIPHMGWNTVHLTTQDGIEATQHALLKDIPLGDGGLHAYFVHSYHFIPSQRQRVMASTYYGGEVTAMVALDNIAGTQFHPEKSQAFGLRLISNFLNWSP